MIDRRSQASPTGNGQRAQCVQNTYRAPDDQLSKENQAVAALVGGDKSAFYACEFHGFQDTLCDFQGRHYFRGC